MDIGSLGLEEVAHRLGGPAQRYVSRPEAWAKSGNGTSALRAEGPSRLRIAPIRTPEYETYTLSNYLLILPVDNWLSSLAADMVTIRS